MMRALAAVLTSAALAGCLDPQSAEHDALRAMERGDHRLVAVQGFATETPGADWSQRERYGCRVIEGTSDMQVLPWDAEYNRRAREYALNYNQTILDQERR